MRCSFTITQNLIWLLFFVLSTLISSSNSEPRTSESLVVCKPTHSQGPTNPNLRKSIIHAMDGVKEEIYDGKLWAYLSLSSSSPEIYALTQCHEDLSVDDCRQCVAESESKIQNKCIDSDSGRVHLDGCFLRFEPHGFGNEDVDRRFDQVKCTESRSGLSLQSYTYNEFQSKLDEAFVNVTLKAVRNGGFGAVEARGEEIVVFALAQCWRTLGERECRHCLVSARSGLKVCAGKTEGRALFTGCYVRYSTERFFNDGAEDENDEGPTDEEILQYAVAMIIFVALAFIGAFIGYRRFSKRKKRAADSSCLNFKYETLEKATDSFHETRKLGQGGAGSVFMGNLPDGRVVAVKRLFFNTRQWVDQFFNEVNLISGIQHKNLVRLLGCSIEGPESLLVYEYVPNRSLDQILFVKNTVHILSWQQRFNIIAGIAEGLEHLHGGCGAKIIHRDIKTSNILLDRNLTPKIADFGLARCVGPDKTHTNTGIAGTLGYMAPEYLVKGQLTEKADVYAFGVLVLEVATGKKNSAFTQESNSILYSVWRHHKANTLTHSIDSRLSRRFPEKEASKILSIGLLCTQASVALRPLMSEIVRMLRIKDSALPSPKQPPFLNASVLTPDDNARVSDIVNTLVLNEEKTGYMSDTCSGPR